MEKSYQIKKEDTLRKISKIYGDPGVSKKLADYNGILNPDSILIGQTIEIPSK